MHRSHRALAALLIFAAMVAFLSGCGPPSSNPAPSRQAGQETQGGQSQQGSYQAADLSVAIGEYMPPLDGGSLEIAAPQGWDWARAGSDYLVGFVPRGSELNNLPRILVSSDESPYSDVREVSEDNVQAFAKMVADSVAGQDLAEPPRPLILGDNAFACYVAYAKRKNAVVSRQVLETVAGGRRYTVRLEVYERQFAKHRDAAYAVAMSIKFSADGDSTPTISEDSQPVAEAGE